MAKKKEEEEHSLAREGGGGRGGSKERIKGEKRKEEKGGGGCIAHCAFPLLFGSVVSLTLIALPPPPPLFCATFTPLVICATNVCAGGLLLT